MTAFRAYSLTFSLKDRNSRARFSIHDTSNDGSQLAGKKNKGTFGNGYIAATFDDHTLILKCGIVQFMKTLEKQIPINLIFRREGNMLCIRCHFVAKDHIRPCRHYRICGAGNSHDLVLVNTEVVIFNKIPKIFLLEYQSMKKIVLDIIFNDFGSRCIVRQIHREQSALCNLIDNIFLNLHTYNNKKG